jgi:hypothetical protein
MEDGGVRAHAQLKTSDVMAQPRAKISSADSRGNIGA